MPKIVYHATRAESERLFSSLNMKFAVCAKRGRGSTIRRKTFWKKKNVYWKKMYNQSHQCDNIFALLALPWQEPRERGVMKKSEDAHSAFIQNRQFRACLLHASNVAISTKPGKKTYILYLLIKIDHCWRELMEINGNITETPQTWRNNIIETVTWLSSSAVQFEN